MRAGTLRVLLCLAVAPMPACFSGRPAGDGPEGGKRAALGSFTIASRTFGDLTLAPSGCAAGDRQSFLGADFTAPDATVVLRLVVDPLEGPAVRLYASEAPFDQSVVFRREDCPTFHFSLESTGWRINDYEDYRITLELDCSREGESVRGSASSTHCH